MELDKDEVIKPYFDALWAQMESDNRFKMVRSTMDINENMYFEFFRFGWLAKQVASNDEET